MPKTQIACYKTKYTLIHICLRAQIHRFTRKVKTRYSHTIRVSVKYTLYEERELIGALLLTEAMEWK